MNENGALNLLRAVFLSPATVNTISKRKVYKNKENKRKIHFAIIDFIRNITQKVYNGIGKEKINIFGATKRWQENILWIR